MSRVSTKGFTIAELLIALAITAMLCTAVAIAINASSINYNVNRDMFEANNRARGALVRMSSQLRTAKAVDPNAQSDGITLIAADDSNITFKYDSGDEKLYLVTNDDTTDADYVLCEKVSAMNFEKNTAVVDEMTIVENVLISMTVSAGDVQQSHTASAVIRRNLR